MLVRMSPNADVNPDVVSSSHPFGLGVGFRKGLVRDSQPNPQQFKNPSIHEN